MKKMLLVLMLATPVLAQMETVDSWLSALPENARNDYKLARYGNQGRDLQVALRSWMARWLNALHDPARAMVQLDFVEVICEDAAQFAQKSRDAAQKSAKASSTTIIIRTYRPPTLGSIGGGGYSAPTASAAQSSGPNQTPAEKAERSSALREARQLLQTIRVRTREPFVMRAISEKQTRVESLLLFYK